MKVKPTEWRFSDTSRGWFEAEDRVRDPKALKVKLDLLERQDDAKGSSGGWIGELLKGNQSSVGGAGGTQKKEEGSGAERVC